ncbi:MAG TPA: SDR family oxidoreductase [Bacteroidales bacterium]|nr:SDR family oxidoreductase [Bacteroidales bacterium]HPS17157.1 SDR family oxidoreductase [Bacteroidales bacterium]
MKNNLNEKIILVTGSSRGIGKAIAMILAQAGAKIIVHYSKNAVAAEETLKQLGENGLYTVKADLSKEDEIIAMVKLIESKTGKIDVLVNNAAWHSNMKPLENNFDTWFTDWKGTIASNLNGTACLSYLASKLMLKNSGGRIINISSRGAFRGEPESWAYGASKAGLNSLGQSMAKALAPQKIFVFTIAPGFVSTEMSQKILNSPQGDEIRNQSPFGRVALPGEIAKIVLFFAGEAPEFMTGCIVDINGASYLRT